MFIMKNITIRASALVTALVCSHIAFAVDKPLESGESPPNYDASIIARDVVVQAGDTLSAIAKRELGRAAFVSVLAEYNNLALSATLTPGDVVRIPIHVPSRGEYAEVVFVKGTVTATRVLATSTRTTVASAAGVTSSAGMNAPIYDFSTEVIDLAKNTKIFPGDEIKTSVDGYASIAFSTGSVINLQPDTVATLQRLACLPTDDSCIIEINTVGGNVTSDVERRDQQPVEFIITTPYASAAVRGTIFDITAAQTLAVGVTEGDVDINAQGELKPLPTGFGLTVEEGQPPGEPVELIPAPVFKRIPARFAPGDTVEWFPFSSASTYKVVLSSDEAANEAFLDFQVPADSSVLPLQDVLTDPVDPGNYFLTLRAVDENGLQGFTSNTPITLAAIDPDIAPAGTRVVREGSEFLVTVEDGPEEALGYEIQISADEAFSDPLSVDVNQSGTAVFRLDQDQVFTRARALVDPFTVSAFGAVGSN